MAEGKKGLTPRQIHAAAVMADPENLELSLKQVAKKANVPYDTLLKWRENDEFMEQSRDFAKRQARGYLHQVYGALVRKALKGDNKAIEMYLTHFDGYTQRSVGGITAGGGVVLNFGADELSPQEREQLKATLSPDGLPPAPEPAKPEESAVAEEAPGDAV